MEILLYISIGWLVVTGSILLRNYFVFSKLAPAESGSSHLPKVSICIPARNEELVIERVVQSVLNQNYPSYEVLVLDDRSEDQTSTILAQLKENNSRLKLLYGSEKPDNWLGKPWACHQLSLHATGEILVFIDADTWWDTHALESIVHAFEYDKLDALTVWPEQHFGSFWESTLVPMVYHTLCSILPIDFVYKLPISMPHSFKKKLAPAFAAACGQCLAFTRTCYEGIKGHEAVKNQVVEDVELAKTIRSSGYILNMYNGLNHVHCRMYTSEHEIWNGFRKNFLAGFKNNLLLFIASAILHLIVYVFPFVGLVFGLVNSQQDIWILSLTSLTLILAHRILLAIMFNWNYAFAFTHLAGVIWFQFLGIRCLIDSFFSKKVTWKGRNI